MFPLKKPHGGWQPATQSGDSKNMRACLKAGLVVGAAPLASACWTLDVPPHPLNPGSTHSVSPAGTPANGEVCAPDGSSNYHLWDGRYDNEAGVFHGVFQTNQCSNDKWGYCPLCDPPQYLVYANHTANCVNQSIPAPEYLPSRAPRGAQLRGRVGLSFAGVNIYGPEEAGFGFGPNPMPCSDGTGSCYAGVDVPACESSLDITCAKTGSKVVHQLMLDSCGGHAFPYHYHNDNACDYDHTLKRHSVAIGVALDGRGIYGLYEGYDEATDTQLKPTDLDACNGHTHAVPANATLGVEGGVVYHYHTTSWAPYTVGCFGPVASVDECRSLYDGSEVETKGLATGRCGAGVYPIYTPDAPDGYCYDTDCPCFEKSTDRLGRNSNLTVAECSCFNTCDETSNAACGGATCEAMLASGDFHCEDDFCPSCAKAGWCDRSCGFGLCADATVAAIADARRARLRL